jgi:uncharacterized membrane protein YfcA
LYSCAAFAYSLAALAIKHPANRVFVGFGYCGRRGGMDFIGMPDVGPWIFFGLSAAAFVTAFIGVTTGAAGGLMLLAILAMVMPPAVLLPIHTVVQLGSNISRTLLMWRYVMHGTLVPFIIGAAIGAAAGAHVFIALPISLLQGILGVFILVMTWMPWLGRFGGAHARFAALGFATTFLGMFVSATGSLLAPLVASSAKNRQSQVATFGALMTVTHIAKLIAFGVIGFAIGHFIPLMAAMIAAGTLGNWLGGKALNRTSEQGFRLIFKVILTLLGLRLVWVALAHLNWS